VIAEKTREQELRNALGRARLPLAVRWLVVRLIDRADHGIAVIPGRFQFARGLDGLAEWCVMPKSTTAAALAQAEFHGWVTRHRAGPGRGHATSYQPGAGTDCLPGCPCRKASNDQTETVQPLDREVSRPSRNAAGHVGVLLEGSKEGEVGEGEPEREPGRKTTTCSTPRCGEPARLYPGGWRCEAHRPRPFSAETGTVRRAAP
jgi:hypothetical protein